ncbi:TonB-dependent receptor, partial [bacterium]|nr:TonB-dependent receptor [bacterium]
MFFRRLVPITILALLLALPMCAYALVTVSGKILDRETGESIPSVAVMIEGTQRGAAANVEGFFSISGIEPGQITLRFSALGYQPSRRELTLVGGQDQHLSIKLVPEAIQAMQVDVVAEREQERSYTPKVAQYSLPTRELAKLPQVLEPDLFRSLQALPGVLATSDFSSELNIWGGSSDQNLILLNGIEVYKPTHLGGLFSVFNMDAVKDVKLIKGGFPAKYGGRLSAVVDVADREGNRNKTMGKVGLSFLSSNATLEGKLPRGSWLVAGRRTYVDAATKLLKNTGVIEDDFPYYFYDFNAKVTRDFANGDRLSPSTYLGNDVLDITSSTKDRIQLNWGNQTFSVPYVRIWHPKLFSVNTFAGSYYRSFMRFETTDQWSEFKNRIRDYTMKTDFSYFATVRHTLDFGFMAKHLDCQFSVISSEAVYHDGNYSGWQYAGYVSDDFRPTSTWTITPGIRVEHNTLSGFTEYLPRLSLKKELSESSFLSAAWGNYAQPFQQVTFGDNFASIFNSYILLDKSFDPNRAQHYALTYENDFEGPFKVTLGAYYKDFQRVIEWNANRPPEEDDRLGDIFIVGDGWAAGGDILLQGQWERYSFMWGYGIGRAKRSLSFWDNGLEYPTSFDRLHNTNLFVSRKVGRRGSLEFRFNYGSGQPVTRASGFYSVG